MSTAFRSAPRSRQPTSNRRSPLYPVPAQPAVRTVSKRSRPPLKAVAPTAGTAVRRLPSSRSLPLWLRLLIQAQRGSLVIAFILVTATLIVYGSTVYTQQLWSKEYRKLKTLQRNEREMIATNEGLKNQLALQADQPGSGLVPQTPDNTIFLQPAPQRPALAAPPSVLKAEVAPNTPLGY
ncbi:hypothetical protein [Stenomitos frigidus]|uniref:Cell division protein FtsL n=1 Tax=Stenomitos frigidus ULC18 TaxID=2107698 RepID=A0A2T1DSU3_9CYAN|nr:hypothetical protein [Stenomitos frigidus]PSB23567.1 hypothetical protein C7B82_30240 [Stenomitos frigidus ULC18]